MLIWFILMAVTLAIYANARLELAIILAPIKTICTAALWYFYYASTGDPAMPLMAILVPAWVFGALALLVLGCRTVECWEKHRGTA